MLNRIKQHIKTWSLPLFVGIALTACMANDLNPGGEEIANGLCMELTLDSNDIDIETRAITGGHTPFTTAERSMETVDLFFYKAEPDKDSDRPIKVASINDKKHGDTQKINISNEEAKALFGENVMEEGGSCIVYAVVNVSDENFKESGILDKESAKISDLRKIKAITPGFAGEFRNFAMFTKEQDGDVVTCDPANKKAEGTVKLKNLAAKIDVFVNFKKNLPGADDQTWNVATSNGVPTAEVHILNGVSAVQLNGFNKDIIEDEDYYSIRVDDDEKYRRGIEGLATTDPLYKDENGAWRWVTSKPYYSYPNSWEDNPLEQHRTSLLLKVDWTTEDNPELVDNMDLLTTYYKVPVDLDNHKLESNHYYRLKLNINSIGGENFGEPLEIEGKWEVLDWGHADLEGDLRETRYLEVYQKQQDRDGTEYTAVVNGNDMLITIPFNSSHKTIIESVTVDYTTYENIQNYYRNNDKDGNRNNVVYSGGVHHTDVLNVKNFIKSYDDLMTNEWHCAYIDDVKKNITIRHKIGQSIDNGTSILPNTSEVYLYTSYLITIQLNHGNYASSFGDDAKITIMHHPPIYVEAEINAGYNDTDYGSFFNGSKEEVDRLMYSATQHHHGFARVNNNNPRNAAWGGLSGIIKANAAPGNWGNDASRSPVMYIINVTQLENDPQFAQYHIRDPRTTVNKAATLLGSRESYTSAGHWLNGQRIATSGHTLEYYYPTEAPEDGGVPAPENMYALSPRFRIASAFGINDSEQTVEQARKRCATYQEYGYPAGRWRLPTLGELKFVQYLSNKKLVPKVFVVDVDYVTAFGVYRFNSQGEERQNGSDGWVRCVYDDWYWVKEDGTPDRIPVDREIYHPENNGWPELDFSQIYNGGTVFVWGDKPKRSPQTPIED